ENLYLYAEDEMSEKDYILKKNIINTKIKEIDTKIKSSATISTSTYNINFFLNTATLELSKEIIEGNINMKSLIQRVGRDIIKEFVNSLITKITVRDRKVISIQFTNGLISTFIYEV
ncbi:recombinase family protein, partial [Clostridium butyricum]|nr:recombinase family protein [Clostridium butyricum]